MRELNNDHLGGPNAVEHWEGAQSYVRSIEVTARGIFVSIRILSQLPGGTCCNFVERNAVIDRSLRCTTLSRRIP